MESRGTMPHAIMLMGREGSGALPLALALAQFVLCEAREERDSCGECPSCRKVARLEHADLHLTFPVYGPKELSDTYVRAFREFVRQTPYGTEYDWLQTIEADNKQGNITSEECETILKNLNLKSYEGGKKVQVIWYADRLGKEGNKLLKLIEEPPADTLLILTALRPDTVLPTILSRTQLVRLAPLAGSEIAAALAARAMADPARAAQVALLADGSYTEALRLLQHLESDLLPEVKTLFNGVFTNNAGMLYRVAEAWGKEGREAQKALLRFSTEILERTVRATHLPDSSDILPEGEGDLVRRLAGRRLSPMVLGRMAAVISESHHSIERNAHSKTVLLAMGIQLARMVRH